MQVTVEARGKAKAESLKVECFQYVWHECDVVIWSRKLAVSAWNRI